MGPRHDLSFCAYKTAWLASELLVSMSPISHVWFLDAKYRLLDRNNKFLWVPDITCHCVHENSVIRTRISSLYVSQTSSVVLSTHNCVLNTDYIGSSRHLWFCACKTATLGLELQVSVGPRPNLWFLSEKQRLLDQNNKSLWVPDMTFVLCMYDSVISTRITRLYGFQPSSVVLCIQNSDLMTAIACVYGSQTSPVIFCMQNSVPSIRITSLYGSQPSSVDFAFKTATFGP